MTFKNAFYQKVVDTLLPGLSATESHLAVPSASEVDVDQQLALHAEVNSSVQLILQTLCDLAGGEELFVELSEEAITAVITQFSDENPSEFQTLLFMIKADYYEHETILQAFGWPSHPPQPSGYPLSPLLDEVSLENVKQKGSIWRKTS